MNPSFTKQINVLKVRRVLKDIAEAKEYGVELNTLTLNELYRKLKETRLQHELFQKGHRSGEQFVYDSNEDQQNQFETEGLDDLKDRVVREYKAKTKKHLSDK